MGLFSSIFAPGEAERSAELDARLREINTRDYGPGGRLYTPNNWEVVQGHLDIQERDTANIENAIQEGFYEGVREGADNIRNFSGDAINGTTRTIFSIIPWQVWFAGAIFVFFYFFGGLQLLKNRFGK